MIKVYTTMYGTDNPTGTPFNLAGEILHTDVDFMLTEMSDEDLLRIVALDLSSVAD